MNHWVVKVYFINTSAPRYATMGKGEREKKKGYRDRGRRRADGGGGREERGRTMGKRCKGEGGNPPLENVRIFRKCL